MSFIFSFLDLPPEIRNKVYALVLLIRKNNTYACRASSAIPTAYGGISIQALHPEECDPSMGRTLFLPNKWSEFDPAGISASYYLDTKVDLQLFKVCRQIYLESSYIFYTGNRFHFDNIEILAPFLQDRPQRARCLMRMISIPVPFNKTHESARAADQVNFEKACLYLSGQSTTTQSTILPNLEHVDLQLKSNMTTWDSPKDGTNVALGERDLDTLTMTRKVAQNLATVADPRIMVFSFAKWRTAGTSGPSVQTVLVSPPVWFVQQLQLYR